LGKVEKNETFEGNIDEAVVIARQNIIDILEDQLYASLKCTFELLSLLYDATDIQVSYSGILSDSHDTRVNAIEFLDNLLQNQMKRRVLPLLEYTVMSDSNQHTALPLKQFSESASLSLLVRTRGKRIKLEILNLIKALGNSKYTAIIEPLKRNKNEEVRKLAFQIIDDLKRQSN
jgi:AAA family ATP:ADP antiporter